MAFPTPPSEPITEIATDTNYDVPGEDWDGEPTKVAPTTAIEEQGYVPGTPRPADVDNWLFNMIAKWLAYLVAFAEELRDTYIAGIGSSTDNRLVRWSGTTGRVVDVGAATLSDAGVLSGLTDITLSGETSYSSTKARTTTIGLTDAKLSGNASFALAGAMSLNTDVGYLQKEIGHELPDGAVLTHIDFLVDPGAARGGGSRMKIDAWKDVLNWSSPGSTVTSLGSSQEDSGAGTIQVITFSLGGGETMQRNSGKKVTVRLTAGADAGTNNDIIYGMRLRWTDSGGRGA